MVYLQPAIDAALPLLRAEAEARMTSTVTIRRKTGVMTASANGLEVPEWATVYADIKARLGGSWGASPSRTVTVGGVSEQEGARTLHLPSDTADLADDDYVEVTAGENAGTVWRIVAADWQDQATARRLPVLAEARPTEWDA